MSKFRMLTNDYMWVRRVVWGIFIMASAAWYIFTQNFAVLLIVLCVVFFPVFGIARAIMLRDHIKVRVKLVGDGVEGQNFPGEVYIHNQGSVAADYVAFKVEYVNCRTGERDDIELGCPVLGKDKIVVPLICTVNNTGKLIVNMLECNVRDVFELVKIPIKCNISESCMVMPDVYDIDIEVKERAAQVIEGNQFLDVRGNDPSETVAVRDYAPGDSVKLMHWKLSEKTGKPMVRELGQPVVSRNLLLLETQIGKSVMIKLADSAMAVYLSAAYSMVDRGITFSAGWNNPETGTLEMREVETREDVTEMMQQLLQMHPKEKQIPVVDTFLEKYPHCSYAHVMVFSSIVQSNMVNLYNGNHVIHVQPYCSQIASGLQTDGTYRIAYHYKKPREGLHRLEV